MKSFTEKTNQPERADHHHAEDREDNQRDGVNPVGQNIQSITELHQHIEDQISPQQRAIERVTAFLGRPRFLFLTLIFVCLWMLVNIVLDRLKLPDFDPPPFLWLQGLLSLDALLMSTVVLITQNRQDQVAEQRDQLDIQASLLVDQKLSKLIQMVDGLRQSCDSGEGKRDPEAEAMKETLDPHQVLSTLNRSLGKTDESRVIGGEK